MESFLVNNFLPALACGRVFDRASKALSSGSSGCTENVRPRSRGDCDDGEEGVAPTERMIKEYELHEEAGR